MRIAVVRCRVIFTAGTVANLLRIVSLPLEDLRAWGYSLCSQVPFFYFLSNPSRRSPGCAEALASSKSLSLLLLTHCGWKTLAAAQ
jgi:hypothetical protein